MALEIMGSDSGDWVVGFYKSFHRTTNNHIKLSALMESLQLVEQRNLLPIKINVDSTKVISMLKMENLHYDVLINEWRSKLRRLGIPSITHCYREQNGVADLMAKKGSNSTNFETVKLFKVPPMCAAKAHWVDNSWTFFERRVKVFNLNNDAPKPRYSLLDLG